MCDCNVLLLHSPITCMSQVHATVHVIVLGGGGGPVPAVFGSKARKYSG